MERQKNDDTLTKLGDLYHYLLVLEHCIDLKEGEAIAVEQFGDLTKLSKQGSFQMEIKHHLDGTKYLSERDIDFWKTLKNWITEHERLKLFNKLVLLTTSRVRGNTIFENWGLSDSGKRLSLIRDVGLENKKNEKKFRPIFNDIFNHQEDVIENVLSRIEILAGESTITKRKDIIKQSPFFMSIDPSDVDTYIQNLMGQLVDIVTRPPHVWLITYAQFNKMAIEERDRFSKGLKPLPALYANKTLESKEGYENKYFVKEIEAIEYYEVIGLAVDDVWRTGQTIIEFFQENPAYLSDIDMYKQTLKEKFSFHKAPYKRKCKRSNSHDMVIDESQNLYDEVMRWEPKPFGSINPNQDFFQRGIIHHIVDEEKNNWRWYLGDEK